MEPVEVNLLVRNIVQNRFGSYLEAVWLFTTAQSDQVTMAYFSKELSFALLLKREATIADILSIFRQIWCLSIVYIIGNPTIWP